MLDAVNAPCQPLRGGEKVSLLTFVRQIRSGKRKSGAVYTLRDSVNDVP
jgi:hypothetical protein